MGRMNYEGPGTDLQVAGLPVADNFRAFAEETGRSLICEIEPGTFMVANTCSLVSTVQVRFVDDTPSCIARQFWHCTASSVQFPSAPF